MSYSYLTFGNAKQLLADRLGDSGFVFWLEDELGLYLTDALRHWNLLSQYHKDRFVFSTVSGQAFYKLSDITSLRSHTITDSQLIKLIQYHLMEPATGTSWAGTEQFTFDIVVDSINRRTNRLLVETGCTLQVDTINSASPPVSRVTLDDDIIDIRRVAWKDTAPWFRNLRQRDSSSRRSFSPRSTYTPGTANSYVKQTTPHVSVELTPPNIDAGQLEIVTTRSQPVVDGSGIVLSIPDDFIPTLKWGVLADLLNTEKAQDVERADYCEQRWQEGIQAAKLSPSVQSLQINGKPMAISSLAQLDNHRPNWENVQGEPNTAGLAGLDLIVLSPVPDGVYSVTMDVVRKAIIPTTDSDFIQIGREYLDILLDYCVHLATFKQGGQTFTSTKSQLEGFLETAMLYNKRLKAQGQNLEAMTAYPNREEQERPREGRLALVK